MDQIERDLLERLKNLYSQLSQAQPHSVAHATLTEAIRTTRDAYEARRDEIRTGVERFRARTRLARGKR